MSVLKRKRNISNLEFYHNALKLRMMMTEFLLKDFGLKDRRRNLEYAKEIYHFSDEDINQLENILTSYNMKNSFIDCFPSWFIDKERMYFMDLLRDLIHNITCANTIYITNKEEYFERRNYQNRAISICEDLLQEMQYIIYVCHPNAEKYMVYVDIIELEITLLKGWRKSDNKVAKNLGNFYNSSVSGSNFANVNSNGNANNNNASNTNGVRP